MVVFDATTILIVIAPGVAGIPKDASNNEISYAKERVDGLIEQIAKDKGKIIIPSPALAEALVRAEPAKAASYIAKLGGSKHFRISTFDERAALEVAFMTRDALSDGDKKSGSPETWAKVKYDRQIVAIAKVEGAHAIYSNDKNLRSFAFKRGLRCIGIEELAIPESVAQTNMFADDGQKSE